MSILVEIYVLTTLVPSRILIFKDLQANLEQGIKIIYRWTDRNRENCPINIIIGKYLV